MTTEQKPVGAICDCPWTYLECVAGKGRIACCNCGRWVSANIVDGLLLEAIQGLYKTLQAELDELKAKLPCERCEGVGTLTSPMGGDGSADRLCPDCRGSGSLVQNPTEETDDG